ncbi:Myocyte-Specific Enhancer Factor 2B [Manis pentadactyla]|nr:Myocyte-Specific Enhancer Factor 2B [Manis pentadactyla]
MAGTDPPESENNGSVCMKKRRGNHEYSNTGRYIDGEDDIYQHLQNPTQDKTGGDVLGGFYFELCPPGGPGADGDGLEDTQEANAANGHSPAHSVKKGKKFAPQITEEVLPPKRCHCLRDSFTEEGEGVAYNHVLKNQIRGP